MEWKGVTVSEEISATLEEYLEAIYRLEEDSGAAKTGDLAKELKVALGTITNTIESMERQGLVLHEPYKGVRLTARGRKRALDVVRRHRLSERFLTDILKIEWSKTHDAACKLEHAIADKDVLEPLDEVLGHPKTCPHGNPIPLESGRMIEEKSQLLANLKQGEGGIITKITDERRDMLQYLATLGLVPGATILIEEKAPFNGPIMIKIMGTSYALGKNVASVIWVKRG
jgi:DtxR family Mn-dependent transcriptional regulator